MLTLIIPAYNESAIILDTIRQADAYLSEHFDAYELLIIDDGSTDGMADLVRSASGANIRLLSYTPNGGKGRAVRTGILAAAGDIIFYTDADLAYGLEVIGQGYDILTETGSDIVLGSRKLDKKGYEGYPLIRKMASRTFSLLARTVSGLPYDTQCGIKGFRRDAAVHIFENCRTDRFAFDFEALMIAQRLHCTVAQMPVSIINHRDSKVNVFADSFRMLRDLLKIRSSVTRRMREGEKNA